ncbi:MAG: M10 family metallopeptidase C-terminal domain-containing protein [Pseudomonadota bacterium]
MCGFCMAAGLADPCAGKHATLDGDIGATSGEPGVSAFVIPDNISTTETITVGGTRDETLEFVGDKDWFRIDLTAGEAIQIDLFGLDHDAGNGLGELVDPYVRIRDSNGNFLAENDDIILGLQRDSRLVFQASETDTYFIEVDSYLSAFTGDYRLQVTATTPPPPASPVDSVETSFTLNTNDPVRVYFAQAGDTYTYDGTTYTATGINTYEQDQLWSIFEGVEEIIDVDFEITTNRNAADLEWATDTLPSVSGGTLLGFFFFPSSNGNGGFGILNNNSSGFPLWNSTPGGTLDTGGFMYGVAVHELGHGLGLAHPHDGGGGSDVMQGVSSSSSRGNFGLNQAPFTAMSYNEGWNDNPAGFASSVASTGHGATFGAIDIAALQNMYGANTTHASGDDVYTLFDTQSTGSGAGYYATWDTGGIDEFRYTGVRAATIDLREATLLYENGGGGFMSYVDGIIAGRTIANGVVIENATSGSGADTLIGNDAANLLIGNAGDDSLTGGGGIDTFGFSFGDGFDTIADFELGTDLIDFLGLGIGFGDLSITDVGGNARVTYDFTTSGQITLTGVAAASLSASDFLLDPSGPQPIIGTAGNDDLTGTADDDVMQGLAGNDTLAPGAGNDSVDAGAGDDTIIYTSGADIIDGGADSDWLDLSGIAGPVTFDLDGSSLGITLSNVENLILSDAGNAGSGDALGNTIVGGAGNDTLTGRGGDDSLDGAGGNDTLDGGAGNDSIDAGAGDDTVIYTEGDDSIDGGTDTDLLDLTGAAAITSVTLRGGAFVTGGQIGADGIENVTVSDAGVEILDSSADNSIAGGTGNDTISLSAGNDSVDGGGGYDIVRVGDGLAGVGFVVDLVAGMATGSNGIVDSFSNVEQVIGGEGDNTFLGTSGNDTVTGNSGNDDFILNDGDDVATTQGDGNTLDGGTGNDTLDGGGTLLGGAGDDSLAGLNGDDTIEGGADADTIDGRAGTDLIIGGTGNDTLRGGTDADTFRFANGDGIDTISDFELGVDQIDLLGLGLSYNELLIIDVIEGALVQYDFTTNAQIIFTGLIADQLTSGNFLLDNSAPPIPAIQITGTALADALAGTSAAEEISGLAGADIVNGRGGGDRLLGGSGDDQHYIYSAADEVIEFAGEGYDRTYGTISFALADNVEAGATRGDGNIDVAGNELDNWITGNDDQNVLRGGAGRDRLISYGGDDTLHGGAGGDILQGGTGADLFRFDVGTGTDYILDYEVGIDLIDVSAIGISYADMTIVDTGGRATVIWDDPGGVGTRGIVIVEGATAADLDLSAFITSFGNVQPAIIGTSGDDILFGSQIADEIQGLGGNDRLDGAQGADTLIGGEGDDRYDVDDLADLVVELAGEGRDIVYTEVDLTLSENVEDARATGSGDIDMTGNDEDNLLNGNDGSNVLRGQSGNDNLLGKGGSDTIDGGTGNDFLRGGDGSDSFAFALGDGADQILDFEHGLDVIDFSATGLSFGDISINDLGSVDQITYGSDSIIVYRATPGLFEETDFVF